MKKVLKMIKEIILFIAQLFFSIGISGLCLVGIDRVFQIGTGLAIVVFVWSAIVLANIKFQNYKSDKTKDDMDA